MIFTVGKTLRKCLALAVLSAWGTVLFHTHSADAGELHKQHAECRICSVVQNETPSAAALPQGPQNFLSQTGSVALPCLPGRRSEQKDGNAPIRAPPSF